MFSSSFLPFFAFRGVVVHDTPSKGYGWVDGVVPPLTQEKGKIEQGTHMHTTKSCHTSIYFTCVDEKEEHCTIGGVAKEGVWLAWHFLRLVISKGRAVEATHKSAHGLPSGSTTLAKKGHNAIETQKKKKKTWPLALGFGPGSTRGMS